MTVGALPVITLFANAASHGDRADMLLRMPVAVIVMECAALFATCMATGFEAGANYVATVTAAATAVRGPDGSLPCEMERQLASAAAPLQQMAEAWRPVTANDGVCRRVEFGPDEPMPPTADEQPDAPENNPACVCPPVRAARNNCPHWRWK